MYKSKSIVLSSDRFEYNKNLCLNFLEGPGVEDGRFMVLLPIQAMELLWPWKLMLAYLK